jgi:hypothetical protein
LCSALDMYCILNTGIAFSIPALHSQYRHCILNTGIVFSIPADWTLVTSVTFGVFCLIMIFLLCAVPSLAFRMNWFLAYLRKLDKLTSCLFCSFVYLFFMYSYKYFSFFRLHRPFLVFLETYFRWHKKRDMTFVAHFPTISVPICWSTLNLNWYKSNVQSRI